MVHFAVADVPDFFCVGAPDHGPEERPPSGGLRGPGGLLRRPLYNWFIYLYIIILPPPILIPGKYKTPENPLTPLTYIFSFWVYLRPDHPIMVASLVIFFGEYEVILTNPTA